MTSAWSRQRSQGFGPTTEVLDGPYQGYAHFNKGIDFAASAGDTVESNIDGEVIAVGNQNDGWGYSVKVRDAQGNIHNYGHLDPKIPVQVGQKVSRGVVIGLVGAKHEGEASTGSHLSYDVRDAKGTFFDPESFITGGDANSAGGVSMPTPVAGGRNYQDDALDAAYKDKKDAFLTASRLWTQAGRPGSGQLFDAYWDSMADLQDFTDTFGQPRSTSNDVDPAQQEFENRIKLGDFDLRQSDSAFNRWFSKYGAAQQNAEADFQQRSQHNADLVELSDARNKSMTPSQLPRNTDRGYIEQSRSDLIDSYLKKFGIGHEAPGAAASGISLPGQGTGGTPAAPAWRTPSGPPATGWQGPIEPGSLDTRAEFVDRDLRQQQPPGDPSTYTGNKPGMFDMNWQTGELDLFGKRFAGVAPSGNNARDLAAGAKKTGKTIKKWWQRGFASGGTNIPAGPAWVGERGPEIHEVPGFGAKMVGMNGPEETYLPEGSNIIPMDEAFMYQQIQAAARQGDQPDVANQTMQAQQRAQDPQLQQKVMAAMKRAMAANMIANPPYTPVLENPALQRDIWAPNRQITGIPASQEEAAMMQQEAAKGAKRRG